MDNAKILEVVQIYRSFFQSKGIEPIDYPHELILDSLDQGLSHCHGMLGKIEQFVKEGRREKAFRWLGFVQGFVWATSHFTLEQLMNHNRPDRGDEE